MSAARTAGGARRSTLLAALLALVASLLAQPTDARLVPVVVSAVGDAADAAAAVADVGGTVTRVVDLVEAAVATVPADRVDDLGTDARVRAVHPDVPVRLQGDAAGTRGSTTYAESVGATATWATGVDGSGVGIAVLDTGVHPHPALAGRVVASADLTSEGTFTDTYGHGTFVTGLAAAVAPGAHIVSVKVAGADGVTTLGQVLYGLQLIDASRDRFTIGVAAVALAAPDLPGRDPLEVAVEQLWADGVVVVAAAGNEGSVPSPGSDPYVLTVGASDDRGTGDRSDDSVPAWSGSDGEGKPELVAPGVSVVSLRAPGSTIDAANPDARVGEDRFVGTGTSMSVGVAAGAVALLLDAEPGLAPDETKGRLVAGATGVPERGLDVVGAIAADGAPAANADLPPIDPLPTRPSADQGRFGFDWYEVDGTARWLTPGWARDVERRGVEAAGRYWAGRYWAGRYWADSAWAGRYWAGSDFLGRYWAGRYWADTDWAGRYWAGRYWATLGWR